MSVTLHTDVGDIKVELYCEQCPKACENFLALCASNYYNGSLFHRNIKGFIVQTGDPTGTGKGGTSIWGRKFEDEFKEELKHNARGMVSMANNGPNSNGSQFFFTYGEQPHLDLKYTLFGRIIDGFEALDDLEKMAVNPKTYRPLTEAKITSVTIHANPLAGFYIQPARVNLTCSDDIARGTGVDGEAVTAWESGLLVPHVNSSRLKVFKISKRK